MSVRNVAVLERTLRSALGSYKFQLGTLTALFRFSGDSGQIPLGLWPSWRHEEADISSVTWCLTSRRLRSAICCQILSSTRRIYLRLPLLTQLDMPQGMCRYIEDHNLGIPRRLRRLSGGPSLRLGIQGTHSIFVCSCSAAALSSPLLGCVLRPRRNRPIPEGVFRGSSLSSLCGPVGFRSVAPHHRSVHPEHFHQRFHMDRFPVGGGVLSAQSLRCRDAPIPRRLVDSNRIQDHWYPGEGQAPASV